MNQAFLLIGGNLGNRQKHLEQAIDLIGQHCGTIIRSSSLYETAAWGTIIQPAFLNQALLITTKLSALQLMQCLLEIELELGRVRIEKSGPRIIDIDLLFFNDEVLESDDLTIPHPRLHQRKFALEPLNEIAPKHQHPVLQKTIRELLQECTDELAVQKI